MLSELGPSWKTVTDGQGAKVHRGNRWYCAHILVLGLQLDAFYEVLRTKCYSVQHQDHNAGLVCEFCLEIIFNPESTAMPTRTLIAKYGPSQMQQADCRHCRAISWRSPSPATLVQRSHADPRVNRPSTICRSDGLATGMEMSVRARRIILTFLEPPIDRLWPLSLSTLAVVDTTLW